VTSSFLCDNCGIKVAAAEGSECPGCGHISGGAQEESHYNTVGSSFSGGNEEAIFSKKNPIGNWSNQHLVDCEALFDRSRPHQDQPEIVQEVIDRTHLKIKEAPDKDSSARLHAYLSEMYRMTFRYEASFENGVHGVDCSEVFFKHQSHNSILDSLFNLNRFQDFEIWIERAREDKFIDVEYYNMRYLTKLEKYDEALAVCETHFNSNMTYANSHRADILVKAGRFEEAEQIFRKLIAIGPKDDFVANWINSLAFSILMPQKRFLEAEQVLLTALCTSNYREKINAFSNLAMVALKLKEFSAAKRYASIAAVHPENAIASESRLTLCEIEYARLLDDDKASGAEWTKLFEQITDSFKITDFDDAPAFLSLLVNVSEKTGQNTELIEVVENEFSKLSKSYEWTSNHQARTEFQRLRIELLSKTYLATKDFLALDNLLITSIGELKDQKIEVLLEYLRSPFAAIDLRRTALNNSNLEFLAEWAAFEEQSEIIFSLAKHPEEPILVALAENSATPDAVCELISSKNDIDLDFALCSRPDLSKKMAQVLARSTFEAVRKLIAMRDDLDDETYRALATDQALIVRDAIRENQHCSADIRALAALGSL
jgi:tetratricopeptide (TPR) repeat protein